MDPITIVVGGILALGAMGAATKRKDRPQAKLKGPKRRKTKQGGKPCVRK